ncbi:MAG: GPP34 family phosphoprotein [Bacteroidales bacterium]|nr:GPP34 family phosphoprotein [Bacteroidales bacterium]MBN2699425.1 GPP34 family phosphoprotein [Bacteroidales bacterium]
MKPGYRETIIMHALYPKRRVTSSTNALKILLYYACLFELAEKNMIRIENKKLWCRDAETGDPVLDKTMSLIMPFSGKSISRMQWLSLIKKGELYGKQLDMMTDNLLLEKEEIMVLFWKAGERVRVRKPDLLKPGITKLERMLVYGRKPDRDALILSVLAFEGNLFQNIFPNKEFRNKAKQRYREFIKSGYIREDRFISLLQKSLRKALAAQKSSTS